VDIDADQTGILLGVFVVLVLVSGFFSGSETALFSLDRIQRRKLVDDSSFRAQTILHVLRHPRTWLSTILFGNTLVNVATASVATVLTHRWISDGGVGYAIVIDTFVVLVFGEIIPKTIAVNAPLRFANAIIIPLHGFRNVTRPLVKVFDLAAHGILKLARVPDDVRPGGLNASEIEILFETAAEQETIDAEGRRLASNIIRFSDTSADTIMTPRPDIVAAPLDSSRESLAELMVKARHSRIPLYEGGVEHIVGFVGTKEFFLNPDRSPRELLNPVAIFPEGAPIDRDAEEPIADDGDRERVRGHRRPRHHRGSRRGNRR
jgi:CBS domain containing-hemolysin-like protein